MSNFNLLYLSIFENYICLLESLLKTQTNSILIFQSYICVLINKLIHIFRVMVFQLLLPLALIILFKYVYGRNPTDLPMAMVNEEWPDLESCPVSNNQSCSPDAFLSCNYYKLLKPYFNIVSKIYKRKFIIV